MRRDKTALMLMEQLAALLIFALAAAFCLQGFVRADKLSQAQTARDRAAALCQNAGEVLRHTGGDFDAAAQVLGAQHHDETSLMADYGEDWTAAGNKMRYTLGACRVETELTGLGKAELWCRDEKEETELFRLTVAWQEVGAHG